MVQFFAIFPIPGILSYDINKMKFTLKSPRILYSCMAVTCGVVELFLHIRGMPAGTISIANLGRLIYFAACVLSSCFMIRTCIKWRDIMLHWRKCEDVFLRLPYKSCKYSLKFLMRTICFSVLGIALSE